MVEIAAQMYHMALQHGQPHLIPADMRDQLIG